MIGHVRSSHQGDIEKILEIGLREGDLKELHALRITARGALEHGLQHSQPECLTIVNDSLPVGMFGVAPSHGGKAGAVWLLGTPGILGISRQFLKESRYWLDHITQGYHMVGNIVHKDNNISIRWLKWLGFTFLRRVGDFIEFARIQ